MSTPNDFLDHVLGPVSVEELNHYTRRELEMNKRLLRYFHLLGVPEGIDRSLSRQELCKQLADEYFGVADRYRQFCSRRNQKIGEQAFDDLRTREFIEPHRPGSANYQVKPEVAHAIQEANLPEQTTKRLFWGAGIEGNGLNRNHIPIAFDPVIGHASHPFSSVANGGARPKDVQYSRALEYSRRKQLERLFPGKTGIIDNYERMMEETRIAYRGGLNHDVAGSVYAGIEAFTRQCGQHGIPNSFDVGNACQRIRQGDTTIIEDMSRMFQKRVPPELEPAIATQVKSAGASGFVERITNSFGAVGTVAKVFKGTGMAAGFVGLVDGSRRAWNAVEVDRNTGETRRNWTQTVAGVGEAAIGAGVAGISAITTGKGIGH